jgi:hypothetical protein
MLEQRNILVCARPILFICLENRKPYERKGVLDAICVFHFSAMECNVTTLVRNIFVFEKYLSN